MQYYHHHVPWHLHGMSVYFVLIPFPKKLIFGLLPMYSIILWKITDLLIVEQTFQKLAYSVLRASLCGSTPGRPTLTVSSVGTLVPFSSSSSFRILYINRSYRNKHQFSRGALRRWTHAWPRSQPAAQISKKATSAHTQRPIKGEKSKISRIGTLYLVN